MKKTYSFVYMSDERFAMPTAVSICSLIKHKDPACEYMIHLILDRVSEEAKRKFEELQTPGTQIILHEVEAEQYEELSKKLSIEEIYVSRTDMLKFELPNFLRDNDRVLYLDGDMIINQCVEPIFDVCLDEAYLAAVDDMGDQVIEGISRNGKRIGLPQIHYFNAGMMYLNLHKMRVDQISEKLWEYRRNGKNYYMSQDALNFVTQEKRVKLPYRYNFITSVFDEMSFDDINHRYGNGTYTDPDSCMKDQVILHMAGRMKPWEYCLPWTSAFFSDYHIISPYHKELLSLRSPIFEKNTEIEEREREVMWRIFTLNIRKGERIALYCAGKRGVFIHDQNRKEGYCFLAHWVDRDAERYGKNEGTTIELPECLKVEDYSAIVIANSSSAAVDAIRMTIMDMGITDKRCVVIG